MRWLLLCLLAALSYGASAQGPESVVQSFVDALNRHDFDAASKYVQGGSVPPFLRDFIASTKQFPSLSVSNVSATLVGGRALVTFYLTETTPIGLPKFDDYLVLVRSGETWLIDNPVKPGGLGEMAYFMSNPPLFIQAHEAAQATKCLTNVKAIALALIMFESDNDDMLTVTVANWQKKIAPYLKTEEVLTCPEDEKGASSYSFNANLAGKSASSFDEPARTVLVYEGKNGRLNFRHNGKAAVAFLDGHAKLISRDEASALLWK